MSILSPGQSQGLWFRDSNGWRWQWFLNGLTPLTNYTAYTLQDGQIVPSNPIMFVTKSGAYIIHIVADRNVDVALLASFECPLAYSIPYCPTVNYAVPLSPPRRPATAYTSSILPSSIEESIVSGMANFTIALKTLACGRDDYSPLVTCADCEAAYRTWLCTISFPRCGESTASSTSTSSSAAPTSSSGGVLGDGSGSGAQAVFPSPALQSVAAGASARNPAMPAFGQAYDAVLPCIEVCTAADRVCPIFLGFRCPLPQFTAGESYGVGFVDSGADGEVGGGSTGVAQDVYGNVFCNGA